MKTDEFIAVIKAYNERKRIQCKDKGIDAEWVDVLFVGEKSADGGICCGQEWDTIHFDYRIKPEPHYRPFENAEEVLDAIKERGDWVRYEITGRVQRILEAGDGMVHIAGHQDNSYKEAKEYFYFLDGTPFGKLEE